ncbi:helix-turn-helix domain-containing protein [Nocardioides sp. JQ2195]|uniref:helix-turn-helix domain-containing protein n=1 Tax=Nocardioides sp. JQ2195 TaxID=2592334 RepID=UPI00197FB4EA|nr:helix-turn-helix domain-containing protein [Nocardioides sp. JQ2195]
MVSDDVRGDYASFMRARRAILGLSQRDLAERSGVKQPLIAAIESGRRHPSPQARARLERALTTRPSVALAARRQQVRELFERAGLPEPRVFGSVARGDDHSDSDIDLMVEFSDAHDIVDLLSLEHELELLLTFNVDLVDARVQGAVTGHGLTEAVAYTVGLGLDSYLADSPQGRVLRNSGRHILIQVATVAEKLPSDFKDAHGSVDWVALARMRNLIAHHYDKVDDRLVFAALERRIPALLGVLGLTD